MSFNYNILKQQISKRNLTNQRRLGRHLQTDINKKKLKLNVTKIKMLVKRIMKDIERMKSLEYLWMGVIID